MAGRVDERREAARRGRAFRAAVAMYRYRPTPEEEAGLREALLAACAERGATEHEREELFDWVAGVRTDMAWIEGILRGHVIVTGFDRDEDGELLSPILDVVLDDKGAP